MRLHYPKSGKTLLPSEKFCFLAEVSLETHKHMDAVPRVKKIDLE